MVTSTTFELSIDGMTCASCAGRVERALAKVPGVEAASVNLANDQARVSVNGPLPVTRLIDAVKQAGYEARPTANPAEEDRARQRAVVSEQRRLALAMLLALPLVLPMLLIPLGVHWVLPPWAQFALATPVQLIAGARFYQAAWAALRAKAANMDLLVALGTTAAYGLSLFLWVNAQPGQPPHLYFETAAMVITLVLLGKTLEGRARRRATGAIRALQALRPAMATRLAGGQEQHVPVEQLRRGDHMRVRPGERFAADGQVLEGLSHVNEALLTGEALPVSKGVGDKVSGGAINGEGVLLLEVTAAGKDTLLEGIIALVETAQAAKAPVQRTVDSISRVFVPVMLLVALVTFLGWYLIRGDMEHALVTAVSVLVIACPCALGLATPAAILAGTGVAARHGILIKDIGIIEVAGRVGHVVFDKTGTLTQGQPALAGVSTSGATEASVLALAGALAYASEHPLAQAVHRACVSRMLAIPPVKSTSALPGLGIKGQVGRQALALGSHRLVEAQHAAVSPTLLDHAQAWEAQGMSVSWLVEQQPTSQVLGVMGFADLARPEAATAINTLNGSGATCHLLTGDNPGSANNIAQTLGITHVQASQLPAQKAEWVTQLNMNAPVVMVGDGLNDGPALAAAAIGIAMGGGTDVAAQAGGVVLARADLRLVPAALDIAARIQRKIHQNLFWAFAYNLIGIPLAACGALSPMFAGAAMALSSVSVVANALLLNTWRPALDTGGNNV